jgi:hypothetical protein
MQDDYVLEERIRGVSSDLLRFILEVVDDGVLPLAYYSHLNAILRDIDPGWCRDPANAKDKHNHAPEVVIPFQR